MRIPRHGALTWNGGVSFNVTDFPIANYDSYSLNVNGTLTVAAADGVLANDFNPDQYPLMALLVQGSAPSGASLTLNTDGGFTFAMNPNQPAPVGSITFEYFEGHDALENGETLQVLTGGSPDAWLTQQSKEKLAKWRKARDLLAK